MKIVKMDREVADTSSLYFDLIKAEFEVTSISTYDGSTWIHLEEEEDKDPIPFAEAWVGVERTPQPRNVLEERRVVYQKFQDEKPLRMENIRARSRVGRVEAAVMERGPEVLALAYAPREGWVKKLFKFW